MLEDFVRRPLGWIIKLVVSRAFIVAIVATACALAAHYDIDLLAGFAELDRTYDGWFIDETCTGIIVTAFLMVGRQTLKLHREVVFRRAAEQRAESLARHDPLTGLPNRRVFQETCAALLGEPAAQRRVALMLIDLDGFKGVNDAFGHAAGDAVLCSVADRLRATIGQRGTIARLGGDEFAVVLERGTGGDALAHLSHRICTELGKAFPFGGSNIVIGATVGVAVAPSDGQSVGELLRAADLAMYKGKAAGRGQYAFFEAGMEHTAMERATLRAELRDALLAGQIVPYYQPLIDLGTRTVTGFEILARWHHPTRGVLAPDRFIPLAEETNTLSQLSASLLRQACNDARAWPDNLRMSLNLSPRQIAEPGIAERLLSILTEFGMPGSRLEIELTEDSLIADFDAVARNIALFRGRGIRVALDDFGTGYSSLFHLRAVQLDKIKIDKSFVQTIAHDARAATYVDAIIGLGRSLQLEVTAEGVETDAVLHILHDLGCDYAQGFLFAGPMPASELPGILQLLRAPTLAAAE